jgi:hypothetical protein
MLGIIIGLPSGYVIMQNNAENSNAALQTNITNLEGQLAEMRTKLDSFQETNANLQQANEHWQQATADLQGENVNLQSNNTALLAESTNLKAQISQVTMPRLATRLGSTKCDWDSTDLRLYIQGEVWNVGLSAAENCSLYVTLFNGNSTAFETHVQIGSILNGAYEDVAENVRYSGFTLTNWTIVPECNP